jgi:hypothetical protein
LQHWRPAEERAARTAVVLGRFADRARRAGRNRGWAGAGMSNDLAARIELLLKDLKLLLQLNLCSQITLPPSKGHSSLPLRFRWAANLPEEPKQSMQGEDREVADTIFGLVAIKCWSLQNLSKY